MTREIVAIPLSQRDLVERAARLTKPLIEKLGLEHAVSGVWSFDFLFGELIPPSIKPEILFGESLGSIAQSKVFGWYEPIQNVVMIDETLDTAQFSARRAFVLFHEVFGHALLQGAHLRSEIAKCVETQLPGDTDLTLSESTRSQLERQANAFCMEIAAPQQLVQASLCRYYDQAERGRMAYKGRGTYCIWNRQVFVDSFEEYCRQLARRIQPAFNGLSLQALGYRVQRSGMVMNQSLGLRLYRSAI